MSFTTELVHGIAAVSADESDGLLTFRPSGSYLTGEIGLYRVVLPEEPPNVVAITLYPLTDLASSGDPVYGVQFRYRATSNATLDEIEDALMSSWSRRGGGSLGTVRLVQSVWSSGASLGQDANDRLVRSVNYYFTVHRPSFTNDNI